MTNAGTTAKKGPEFKSLNINTLSDFLQTGNYRAIVNFLTVCLLCHSSVYGSSEKGPSRTAALSLPYERCFADAAVKYRLDRNRLTAIAIVESSLRPEAVSVSNAIGIMQIKWPQTAKHLGVQDKRQLFEPCFNIETGAKYLRELADRYNGDHDKALAAYRIGPSALKKLSTPSKVVNDYKRKVDAQYDILTKNLAAKVLPTKPSVVTDSKNLNKADNLEALKEIQTVEVELSKNATPAHVSVGKIRASPQCNLGKLQILTLSTHVPAERERRFLDWAIHNGPDCSLGQLTSLLNQVPVWLGTADTAKARSIINHLTDKIGEESGR